MLNMYIHNRSQQHRSLLLLYTCYTTTLPGIISMRSWRHLPLSYYLQTPTIKNPYISKNVVSKESVLRTSLTSHMTNSIQKFGVTREENTPLESGSKFKFPPKDAFRFVRSLSVEPLMPTFVYLRRRVWGFPAIDFRSIAGESLRAPFTGGRGTWVWSRALATSLSNGSLSKHNSSINYNSCSIDPMN